jgi:hypothetical protein
MVTGMYIFSRAAETFTLTRDQPLFLPAPIYSRIDVPKDYLYSSEYFFHVTHAHACTPYEYIFPFLFSLSHWTNRTVIAHVTFARFRGNTNFRIETYEENGQVRTSFVLIKSRERERVRA